MQPQNDQWQQPDRRQAASDHQLTEPVNSPTPTDSDNQSPTFTTAPVEMRDGDDTVVRWQASEYIQHSKSVGWYVGLAVVTVLLMLFSIFVLKSISFSILLPVMAAALLVYVLMPPEMISYTLSRKGLHINDKLHNFADYREFGVVRDELANSIVLIPRKRFLPSVSVYFPTEVGEAIVDMLAARLPMRETKLDPVDKLIRILRI